MSEPEAKDPTVPSVRRPARWWWRTGAALALALIAAPAVLAWRSRHHDGNDQTTLIVGDQRGGVQSLLKAAGELDHVPYRIEWAIFPAASPLLEALNSGAVDVGGIGGAPFAFAYGSGAKIRVVYAGRAVTGHGSASSGIVVPGASPIHTLADLRGKRLATVRGSAGQDIALQLLARHGLTGGDVRWTYLNNSEAKAALGSGAVDAWSTWGAYVGIAVLKDGARAIATGSELPAQAGFYAANDHAIAAKSAQLADFVKRLVRARGWLATHRDDYARVLAHETGIPVDVARYSVDDLVTRPVPLDANVRAEQEAILHRYQAIGLIRQVPDLGGAFDPAITKAAGAIGGH